MATKVVVLQSGLWQRHEVRVWERMAVRVEPEFLLLKRGETGRLRCRLSGLSPFAPVHVHWLRSGQRLHRKSFPFILSHHVPVHN